MRSTYETTEWVKSIEDDKASGAVDIYLVSTGSDAMAFALPAKLYVICVALNG